MRASPPRARSRGSRLVTDCRHRQPPCRRRTRAAGARVRDTAAARRHVQRGVSPGSSGNRAVGMLRRVVYPRGAQAAVPLEPTQRRRDGSARRSRAIDEVEPVLATVGIAWRTDTTVTLSCRMTASFVLRHRWVPPRRGGLEQATDRGQDASDGRRGRDRLRRGRGPGRPVRIGRDRRRPARKFV